MQVTTSEFEDIVRQYQKELINFHFRFVGNRFEAEDLAQDTLVKAYKKLYTLQNPPKLRSWLFSIARNIVVDFFRKNDRYIPFDHESLERLANNATVVAQPAVYDQALGKELEKCIAQLVKEDQAIVRLLYYERFSYDEIAELLHMNQNTLKSRLHRARRTLLEIIRSSKPLAEVALEYEQHRSSR